MEDRGYLVAHPTLIDPKGHAPAEQQHITHKVKDQGLSYKCKNHNFFPPLFMCIFLPFLILSPRLFHVRSRWWLMTSWTIPTLSRKTCATASVTAPCSASTSSTPASWWVRRTRGNWMYEWLHRNTDWDSRQTQTHSSRSNMRICDSTTLLPGGDPWCCNVELFLCTIILLKLQCFVSLQSILSQFKI